MHHVELLPLSKQALVFHFTVRISPLPFWWSWRFLGKSEALDDSALLNYINTQPIKSEPFGSLKSRIMADFE